MRCGEAAATHCQGATDVIGYGAGIYSLHVVQAQYAWGQATVTGGAHTELAFAVKGREKDLDHGAGFDWGCGGWEGAQYGVMVVVAFAAGLRLASRR